MKALPNGDFAFGTKDEVKHIDHVIGAAIGWVAIRERTPFT